MARARISRPPLTKRFIDAAKPSREIRTSKKSRRAFTPDLIFWDGLEHGLGIKVTPKGSKVFIFQKSVHGRLKRITLGAYGDLTLDEARKEARRLNGEIAKGRDPVEDARAERAERERRERSEQTVSDLWQRYWVEVVSTVNRPRTATEKRNMWRSRIKPSLGRIKLKDITDQDASSVVRAPLRLDEQGRIIGGLAAAGNLYRLLHHLFAKALQWRLRALALGNPLDSVAEPKVQRRERLLTQGEVGALLKALNRARTEEQNSAIACIELTFFTGARISEISGLRWDEVRRDELELHLRDTKTGFSRRPVSRSAMEIIIGMRRVPGSPYVFPSKVAPTRPVEYAVVRRVFASIVARAGIEDCTLHTVRHWFSTMTANAVSNPRVGMALTGHKSHAAYMTYVHGDRDQARALADQLGAFARSLTKSKKNVVQLKSVRGKRAARC